MSAIAPTVGICNLAESVILELQEKGHLQPIDTNSPLTVVCADRRPIHPGAFEDAAQIESSPIAMLGASIGLGACVTVDTLINTGEAELTKVTDSLSPGNPIIAFSALISTQPSGNIMHTVHSSFKAEGQPIGLQPGKPKTHKPDCYFMTNLAEILTLSSSDDALRMARSMQSEYGTPGSKDDLELVHQGLIWLTQNFTEMHITRDRLLPHTKSGYDKGNLRVLNVMDTGADHTRRQPLVVDYRGTTRIRGAYHHSVAGAGIAARRTAEHLGLQATPAVEHAAILFSLGTAMHMGVDIAVIPKAA